jgi:hypothetical protein
MLACLYTDAILHYQEERVCLSKHLIKENKLFIVFFFISKVKIPTSASLSAFPFILLFGPLSWLQRLKNSQAAAKNILPHYKAPLNLEWERRRRRKIISVSGKRGSLRTMLILFQGERQTLQFKFHVHAHRSLLFCLLLRSSMLGMFILL